MLLAILWTEKNRNQTKHETREVKAQILFQLNADGLLPAKEKKKERKEERERENKAGVQMNNVFPFILFPLNFMLLSSISSKDPWKRFFFWFHTFSKCFS